MPLIMFSQTKMSHKVDSSVRNLPHPDINFKIEPYVKVVWFRAHVFEPVDY